MAATATFLAFDLGAESGRAVISRLEAGRLHLEEIHRFANGPVRVHDHLYWDVLRLFEEIKRGLSLGARKVPQIDGIGLSTWGVDSALLDKQGELLANPYCYRDPRTGGMMDKVFARMSRQEIFQHTGIQFMPLNTLYQLYATAVLQPARMENAGTLLMMPDLFNYWLTGRKGCELTDASTTQFFDAHKRTWSREIFERLALPIRILPEIYPPGTVLGPLLPSVAEEVGLSGVPVIAPASHDTASAVAAVPASQQGAVYISSGTWSAVGAEVDRPVITDQTLRDNFTNESGVGGKYMFRKNVMGLWLLQESRRTWAEAGEEYDYATLARMGAQARPFGPVVEPDHESFLAPGDMPSRINDFCKNTGQEPPADKGALVRCVLESLALKYRWIVDRMEDALGPLAPVVNVVGGGSRNELLCQVTANALGKTVLAGPSEATTLGNVLVQAIARGHVASLDEGRGIVRSSIELKEYPPQERRRWEEFYARFLKVKEKSTTLL
ncbi:MAG: rhamnulokinase [Anaerolineae bacterium]|nr:rhamnulokinase [Anaerolineae bacterium]